MDTIRLFLRSNSFRNSPIKPDGNSRNSSITSNFIDIDNDTLIETEIRRNSSSEKFKSFLSTHTKSSSLSSRYPNRYSQVETCSGLSIPLSNNTNIVASASESISNARSFTLNNNHQIKPRRHSWTTGEQKIHHVSSSIKRSKSHYYSERMKKYSKDKKRRRTIQINRSSKSVSFPLSSNNNNNPLYPRTSIQTRSVKTTATNAFLTAASIFKYWPFQSTYRQRNEEFRKIFKDLPTDERLIVDYSCAWQKEILIQGRMYISQNYLCFHANFLKWETSLCLKFKDIGAITREKTAKVIPNAIEVKSNKNEKYFFASFATRDKSYGLIYRIWQMTVTDQSISSQQLWALIRESYGNDVDMVTDEEDTQQKPSTNSTPERTSPKQQIKNTTSDKYDRIKKPESVCSKSSKKDETDDHSSLSSRGDEDLDEDIGIIPIGEEANTNTLIRQPPPPPPPININSFTSMDISPERNYLTTCPCPCQSHLATKLIDRTYSTSVERLFDYIFDDRDFLAAYHASRRIKDFHAGEWTVNKETGKRERLCTYKVDVAAVFGATTICSNEKQVIDCELSKSHYIIDTEVRNEGIKYADTFFVASRYCIVQIGANKSHLKVTCEVRYVKSVMMIIKSFIEKNAMAALQDSFTDLNNRIELSTSSVKRIEHETSNKQRSSSITNNHEKDKTNQSTNMPKKKYSRKQQLNELDTSIDDSPTNKHRKIIQDDFNNNNQNSNSIVSSSSDKTSSSRSSTESTLIPFIIIIMLILLIVNIFLCFKLNEIDRMTDNLVQNYPLWSNGFTYPKEENEWSILLKRQEEYYQTKLNGLHSILSSTHNALLNVTDALNELSKLSSGLNKNAPINRLHSS
ncbi:unnamed protein product [Adineta steineri]|uniref:VASt domain-containing protein n=1 Tax=Adineta steineri TaxID=433720 RepID=A0A814DM52_9BILA|nr:unnamed protein product [Adineta steineri]CAF0956745.1 unnamed protein product [Adineta steineri]CAF0961793.1 unnamed protein product [Adineta steineri]